MKNLYLLRRDGSNQSSFELLSNAAQQRGIKVIDMDWSDVDFSNPPVLTRDDGMYAVSSGKKILLLEKVLLNNEVCTFYENYTYGIMKPEAVVGTGLLHQKAGLPLIPTIFSLSTDKAMLQHYVESLGGFPVIIKCSGGSHGKGVMKVDSLESLTSICDFLLTTQQSYVLKAFIPHKKQARLIVLGDKVIAAHQNYATLDFRSNVGDNSDRKREVVPFTDEVCDLAVRAVQSLHREFGGVDILFDENTELPYIAEVNFPCFFPTTQQLTGIDIAGKMIDYLVEKGRK